MAEYMENQMDDQIEGGIRHEQYLTESLDMCVKALKAIRDFDEDKSGFDDPGQIAIEALRRIEIED